MSEASEVNEMSYREQLVQTAQGVSEENARMLYFLMKQYLLALEEAEDEAFCNALNDAFLANPDKGELVDFDDACKMLGVQL